MKKIDPFLLTILHQNETKLPLDIWLEDCIIDWPLNHNPYKVLIPNKYGKYYLKKCLWLSIDKYNPKILTSKKVKIKSEDLEEINDYIKNNYEDFVKHIELKECDYLIHLKLSQDKDDQQKYESLKIKNNYLYLKMFNKMFYNACIISSNITNLDVNIYSIHNGICANKYYKPKIMIGLKGKYFIIATIEEEPIIIYETLGITQDEQAKCQQALRYVQKNIDLFLKHYNDSKDSFNDKDLINSLDKRNVFKKKMIH